MANNILDFGADPTGIADSAPAFMAAIASFGPTNDSFAGTVIVPFGTFRFASPVRIKKSVLIQGEQGASTYLSTVIVPDAGIEAFVFEAEDT
jgi:polygalacturonase